MGFCSSSLDPQETNPHLPPGTHLSADAYTVFGPDSAPPTPSESAFRHSGWAARRLQVWQALIRTSAKANRLQAFANCGGALWLAIDDADRSLHLQSNCCHDRLCVPCGTAKARQVADRLGKLLGGQTTRFVTLTLRANHLPLTQQLDRLYSCFAALRRRKAWKAHVRGAVACCEVKLGANSGAWHCHLHVITEGLWWDQAELSREWYAVTGDSSIVHVRLVADRTRAVHYVTKYVTKPLDGTLFARQDRLDEAVLALKGRRLLLPVGTFRQMLRTIDQEPVAKLRPLGSIPHLARTAAEGDPEAQHWWRLALAAFPQLIVFNRCTPPPDG